MGGCAREPSRRRGRFAAAGLADQPRCVAIRREMFRKSEGLVHAIEIGEQIVATGLIEARGC